MINRIFIMLSALCISWGVQAHQPDLSSTLLVEQGENIWVLQVRAALTAFEYEIEQHFGEDSYATPEEFQGLVIKHIEENTFIKFNNTDGIVLQNGWVKLGHETSVTFEVVGTPETIQSLKVKNSSFSQISRNQSALMVVKKGFSKNQFTLNNNNQHTVELAINDSKFELIAATQKKASIHLLLIFGVFLLLLSVVHFTFKKRKAMKLNTLALG